MKDVAAEVDSPDLALPFAEAQLREGDAHLGHPPKRVHRGRGVPDGIPPGVHPLEPVVGCDQVVATSGGGDPEHERGAMVVVGVELDQKQVVRLHEGIATAAQQRNPGRIAVVHARADVKGVVGVRHPDLGALRRRQAVARPVAAKPGHGNRPLPHGIVQHAVKHRCGIGTHGGDRRRDHAVGVGERGVGGRPDLLRGLRAQCGGD